MDNGLVRIVTPDEVMQAELDTALDNERREQAVRDAFASDLQSRWQGYREARREVEEEWLASLRAVKGEYGPEQIQKNVTIQHPAKAYCCNFEPL
ncbi:hypothetical protein [Endozoicomonas sp.]|uniref:hypothetical protein n=1 Tax=Endozoicomonas sp. TaxID=1892382 RepID=UPI003AF7B091